ncbi:MAG: peptidoglycan D,D-transpeptidase FtsI family protein, partial [Actinomycetota bacterium]
LAAQVLGFVGTNNQGLAGLESKYDSVLSGSPGQILTERDPQGRKIPAGRSFARPAVPGRDLVLTVDAQIQFEAERLLAEALKKWRAKSGTAVVMDPRTGDVLALANAPSFDPNNFRAFAPEVRRNRAVMDVYEPGSANKAIVAAAAIESGLTSPQEVFSVPDVFRIADKVFKDSHPHPTLNLTFSGVIERSSNVGTIKVAQRLGRERLYEYLERFGYGKTTGLGFPGESPGILPKTNKWWTTSMGSIPIGHGVATTTMQIIDVFAAIANRGELVAPKLVKGFVSNGKIDQPPPSSTRRVINEQTARTVTQMLLEVTEGKEGTGALARVPGVQVAGKTGTAQKPLPKGKGYEGYVSSFIGFAPAGAPRLVAGVVLDDPKPIWGGVTAAVTFQQLMEFSLRHLGIGPGPVLP